MGWQQARALTSEGGVPATLAQSNPEVSTEASAQAATTTSGIYKPFASSRSGQDRTWLWSHWVWISHALYMCALHLTRTKPQGRASIQLHALVPRKFSRPCYFTQHTQTFGLTCFRHQNWPNPWTLPAPAPSKIQESVELILCEWTRPIFPRR